MEKIVIQSDNNGLATVERYIGILCDEKNVYNYFATISMSVLQAVDNAIKHGNNNNPSKQVTVECGHYCGGIYFEIEDEGSGFDVSRYGDLPLDQNAGEGIFIMKSLSDKLEYSNEGRKVRLEFAINGIDASESLERKTILKQFFVSKEVHA